MTPSQRKQAIEGIKLAFSGWAESQMEDYFKDSFENNKQDAISHIAVCAKDDFYEAMENEFFEEAIRDLAFEWYDIFSKPVEQDESPYDQNSTIAI